MDAATALGVMVPTLSEVMKDLIRKSWATKRCSVTDARVIHLRLTQRGRMLAQKIEDQVRKVRMGAATNEILTAAGLKRLSHVPPQLKEISS